MIRTKGLVILFVIVLVGCGRSTFDNAVVVEVGDAKISASRFRTALYAAKASYDPKLIEMRENKEALKKKVVEDLVVEQLLLQEAIRRSITLSEDEINSEVKALGIKRGEDSGSKESKGRGEEQLVERVSEILLRQKVEEQLLNELVLVSPSEVRQYYLSHQSEFRRPAQCRFVEIRMDELATANEVREKAIQGEDFKALVRRYSSGPYKERDGDTGFMNKEILPDFLARQCEVLEIGGVSEVLDTPYGFYVVKLLDKRRPSNIDLEEARPLIERIIRREKGREVLEGWLAEQWKTTPIIIHEEVIGAID